MNQQHEHLIPQEPTPTKSRRWTLARKRRRGRGGARAPGARLEALEPRWLLSADCGGACGEAAFAASGDITVQNTAQISGRTWFDTNFNGVINLGESGIGGWEIFLDANNNGVKDPGEVSTITDAFGEYSFSNLTAGTYRVAAVAEDGWIQTFPAGVSHVVTVTSTQAVGNINFGQVRSGSIIGTVFNDTDGDAIRDAGEIGLNGWTIELIDPANNQVVATTITADVDLNGNGTIQPATERGVYVFDDLLPKTYLVRQVAQNGFVRTFPVPPDATLDARLVSGAVLEIENLNFGVVQQATVAGQVWNDADGDGVVDAGENGLSGWQVYADRNGNGVRDGQMDVTQTFNYTGGPLAIPDNGPPVTPTINVAGMMGSIFDVNVTLSINHTFTGDLDAFLISPTGTRVELFRRVGADGDHFINTTLDDEAATPITSGSAPFTGSFRPQGQLSILDGELPNGVWTLEVADDLPTVTGTFQTWALQLTTRVAAEPTTTTDANGNYTLSGLTPGAQTIRATSQAGFVQTAPAGGHNVNLTAGQNVAGRNFGQQAASVSLDVDANGSLQALADGLLIVRYMAGFTGGALVNNALGAGATRTDPAAIVAFLNGGNPAMLDVDGNGAVQALADGLLIVRYLAGFTGAALVNNALGAGATRTDPAAIVAFLNQFNPAVPNSAAAATSGDSPTFTSAEQNALASAWLAQRTGTNTTSSSKLASPWSDPDTDDLIADMLQS